MGLKEKISFILKQNDRASDLVKDIMIYTCVYASNRLFEISNSLEDIDNCMKWGFNWSKGPFEVCDIIGIREFLHIANEKKCRIPTWVLNKDLLKKNHFYIYENNKKKVWCPLKNEYIDVKQEKEKILDFSMLKDNSSKIIK